MCPFELLHDAISNNALYDLVKNWRDLQKRQVPEADDTLPMVFARYELALFVNTDHSKGGWERGTSRKPPRNESKAFDLKKRSRIEAGSVGGPSSNGKQEHVLDYVAPAFSTLLPHAAMDALWVVLDEMSLVCTVHDVDFGIS